jgi:hypothetical protein
MPDGACRKLYASFGHPSAVANSVPDTRPNVQVLRVWQNVGPDRCQKPKSSGNWRVRVVPQAFSWALRASVVLLAVTGQPVRAHQIASDPPAAQCELSLQRVDQSWKGVCGPLFSNKEPTTLTARKATSLPGGAGRGDAVPSLMLVAKLTGRPETSDLELEFYGKDGVIRSQVGWRMVTVMSESATTLQFRVADTEPEPTDLDLRIVERAAEILASEAVWDRADDRTCAPDDKTWSLYCALHRASLELTGGFHHRRPCFQIVRQLLYERVAEERKKGRKYPHIMMDYNNDPAVRLSDVLSVFAEAAGRMKR